MIRMTILEIVLVVVGVFLSIPLWQSFDLKEYESLAMYYDSISYTNMEVEGIEDYVLYQTSDELAVDNIKPININLTNTGNNNENYSVWLIVSKKSTLDYTKIKIRHENKIAYLNDYKVVEDEAYYYISLNEGAINSNDISFEIQLWIDSEYNEDITNKFLSFDIENNPGQVL